MKEQIIKIINTVLSAPIGIVISVIALAIILCIYVIFRKKIKSRIFDKEAKEKKKKAAALKRARRSIAQSVEKHFVSEILPLARWDDTLDVGIMENDEYVDFLGIRVKDLVSASEDQVSYDVMLWDRLYKTYADDLKIVSFNFPTDTSKQVEYIDAVLRRTDNPVYRDQLEKKRDQLIYINKYMKDKQFILCLYASSYQEYEDKFRQIVMGLGDLVYTLSPEEKKHIVYIMYNKCTAL